MTVPAAVEGDYLLSAAWLRERGVVVLPADHPLRTGQPSEKMIEAAAKTIPDWDSHECDSLAVGDMEMRAILMEEAEKGLRAALAVLRV